MVVRVCASGEDLARGGDGALRVRGLGRGPRLWPAGRSVRGLLGALLRGQAAGEGEEAGAGRRDGADGQAGAYVLLGEHAAAVQEGGRGGVAAQGPERGEVVRVRAVAAAERLLQEQEVAGRCAGQCGPVAGEVGHQEGPEPGSLAGRLVDGLCELEAVLEVLGRDGAGVKGEGESATEHTQLLRTERHAAAGSVWRGHAATIRANQTKRAYQASVARLPPGALREDSCSSPGALLEHRRRYLQRLPRCPTGGPLQACSGPTYATRSARTPAAARSASATARARR